MKEVFKHIEVEIGAEEYCKDRDNTNGTNKTL